MAHTESRTTESENLYKPSEAARKIGITTETLHVWRRNGYIMAVELPNGRYGVTQSEIDRLSRGRR